MADFRIDEIEPVNGGTFMVHLVDGYRINDTGTHTFGADTLREIQSEMKRVQPCHCADCLSKQRQAFDPMTGRAAS